MMAAAAVWGVLQLFAVSWPTRSVRLSTVLLALAVGVYGCGVATALVELAYTRFYADQSGQSLIMVVNTTSYTVAPWVEELIKVSPLLLAGLSVKVRRQWGLTDFVVLGAALGGGSGCWRRYFGTAWTRTGRLPGVGAGSSRTACPRPMCRAWGRC